MRILALLAFSFLSLHSLKAQTVIKYFLNNREIAGPALYCLQPSSIDSVRSYTGTEARTKFKIKAGNADSVHMVFIKDVEDVVSYRELLDLYHVDSSAMKFELGISSYPNIEDKELMVFSKKYITGVRIFGWRQASVFFVTVEIPRIIGWPEYKDENIMIPLLRRLNSDGFSKERVNRKN